MLQIKQKFHISLPHLALVAHKLKLSQPTPENDELIEAISKDTTTHDDTWQLSERPDSTELTRFWGTVEDDIHHDPEWITIVED